MAEPNQANNLNSFRSEWETFIFASDDAEWETLLTVDDGDVLVRINGKREELARWVVRGVQFVERNNSPTRLIKHNFLRLKLEKVKVSA